MTIYTYLALSKEEQWNVLWEKGEHIDNFKSINHKFSLYALYKFFVEVELSVATEEILGKCIFKTGDSLNKYSGNIEI